MNSLYTLLQNAIDYAGLFPPAKLGMHAAVENYAAYVASEHSWLLGRFIVPAGRLAEFEHAALNTLPSPGRTPWHITVLGSGNLPEDLARIQEFNERHASPSSPGQAIIDTIELKASAADEILNSAITVNSQPGSSLAIYFEIPVDQDPAGLVAAVASVHARAKIRTGGISPDAFPATTDVVRFMKACTREGVPYKATAGLHHAIKGEYRLTYEPNSPSAMMFGFLNLFVTGAFVATGMDEDDAAQLLETRAADAIQLDDEGISWRGHHVTLEDLRKSRQVNAVSFGSCSFLEPVEELKELGILWSYPEREV